MIAIISALILWSSLGVLIKLSGASPIDLIFFPCVCSLLLLTVILTARREKPAVPDRNALGGIVLLGFVALINTGSFFFAYHYTSIANAVLAHYTAPGFVALLSPFLLGEKFTLRMLVAMTLAACGLWIILGVDMSTLLHDLASGDRDSLGILFGLISGLSYAFVIIIIRKISPGMDPLVLTLGQNLVVVVLLLPIVEPPAPFFPAGWLFLAIGIVHSTIAPILYFRGMRTIHANKAAILGYFEPVGAIVLAAAVLGESITAATVFGGAMILASGYLAREL